MEHWFSGVPAFEGRQFAELNANSIGALYQEISGIPGNAAVGFKFAHRGRAGNETIRVTITDFGSDGVRGGGNDTVLFTKDYTDGTGAWGAYTSLTEVPILALGNTVRFQFESLNGGSVGNFLDDADFGIDVFDAAPNANADVDQSVNEEQIVTLSGILSSDPDDDPITYLWEQTGGTPVDLSDSGAIEPTFDAPVVALGGETLTFRLTVTANGQSDTDTVDITVVNVNHPPVADAGDDQSIAEGAPVALDGTDSFDIDSDTITYSWVQVDGLSVTITGADTASPSFIAPDGGGGGAPGVVATLVFELVVHDGFDFSDVATVTVEITNVNNDPIAVAGDDQTLNELSAVQLDGTGSSDPDSDVLTYAWVQVGGTGVILLDDTTAAPSFTAPFVSLGGEDLTFELTVDDGFGGTATDQITVHVQNANDPPDASLAQPTVGCMWPPNHKMVHVGIIGVSDAEDNATITIDGVTQDEVTNGLGDGDTAVDAIINGDGTVLLRAERSGTGDGRIYHIAFTASDLEGSSSGVVDVCVPHSKKSVAVDSGDTYNSTE